MQSTSRRKFLMLDAMVMMAATAVALAILAGTGTNLERLADWVRDSVENVGKPPEGWFFSLWAIFVIDSLATVIAFPFCLVWTLAAIGLRYRQPRPPLRRVASLAGATACWAAAVPVVPGFLACLYDWQDRSLIFMTPWPYSWDFVIGGQHELDLLFLPSWGGLAVLGSWTTLILGRRWTAEPTWIDRVGRLLGIYWLSTLIPPLLIFLPF